MILAVDAGNTRIKWGLHDGNSWQAKGWVATADAAGLGDAWKDLAAPERIVASNVAGPQVAMQIEEACKGWPARIQWIVAVESQCGVSNGYEIPSQLGSDRWAALIAARAIAPEGCVVVNAGTAMTVDALTADGVFLGGLIVPGLATMLRALAENTAAIGGGGRSLHGYPQKYCRCGLQRRIVRHGGGGLAHECLARRRDQAGADLFAERRRCSIASAATVR